MTISNVMTASKLSTFQDSRVLLLLPAHVTLAVIVKMILDHWSYLSCPVLSCQEMWWFKLFSFTREIKDEVSLCHQPIEKYCKKNLLEILTSTSMIIFAAVLVWIKLRNYFYLRVKFWSLPWMICSNIYNLWLQSVSDWSRGKKSGIIFDVWLVWPISCWGREEENIETKLISVSLVLIPWEFPQEITNDIPIKLIIQLHP